MGALRRLALKAAAAGSRRLIPGDRWPESGEGIRSIVAGSSDGDESTVSRHERSTAADGASLACDPGRSMDSSTQRCSAACYCWGSSPRCLSSGKMGPQPWYHSIVHCRRYFQQLRQRARVPKS